MISELFHTCLPVIGYVQLDALTESNFDYAQAKGLLDTIHLKRGGIDAIVVENYLEPEMGSYASAKSKYFMENVCCKIKTVIKGTPLGINVLPADTAASFEIAERNDFDFVHADIYSDSVRSLETGRQIKADLEYVNKSRKSGIRHIPLIATIKPWHAYELCSDEAIEQSAENAVEHGADALVVVGKKGHAPALHHLRGVRSAVRVPVGVGSGIHDTNIVNYSKEADFFLASGFFKYNRRKTNPIDEDRVKILMEVVYKMRG